MSTNYDVRPAPPKPDLSKYPQIPKGACLNWNKTTRTFQVYLHAYKTDSATGEKKKTRISLGALKENGDYQISRTWQLSREKEELQNLLREAGSADAERAGKAVEALSSAASEAKIDTRQQSKVVHSLDAVLLGTVLMSPEATAMPPQSAMGLTAASERLYLSHICQISSQRSRYPMTL